MKTWTKIHTRHKRRQNLPVRITALCKGDDFFLFAPHSILLKVWGILFHFSPTPSCGMRNDLERKSLRQQGSATTCSSFSSRGSAEFNILLPMWSAFFLSLGGGRWGSTGDFFLSSAISLPPHRHSPGQALFLWRGHRHFGVARFNLGKMSGKFNFEHRSKSLFHLHQ